MANFIDETQILEENDASQSRQGAISGIETKKRELAEMSDINSANETTPLLEQSTAVYKKRFLILLIFSLTSGFNGMLFISVVPVTDIIAKYYEVSTIQVEWLSLLFMICSFTAFPVSYFISKWGVKPVVIAGSFLNLLTVAIQVPSYKKDRFALLLFGQIFAAIAYGIIFQLLAKVSSVWFPPHERTTATSISFAMNCLGMCIGFLQPSMMIKDDNKVGKNLENFHLSRLIVGGLTFLASLLFRERPILPPSLSCERESISFRESLRVLVRNKNFHLMMQFAALVYSATVTLSVLLNTLVTKTPAYHHGYDSQIGWMGFASIVTGTVTTLVFAKLTDLYRKYKLVTFITTLLSLAFSVSFVAVLTNTNNFTALFSLFVLLGAFNFACAPIVFEMAAETFYPVSEEVFSMSGFVLANLYSFAFTFLLGFIISKHGYTALAGYILSSFYGIALILVVFIGVDMKRSQAD